MISKIHRVLRLLEERILRFDASAGLFVFQNAHGEELGRRAAVLPLRLKMGFKRQPRLFDHRDCLRVDTDVVAETERAVIGKDLDHIVLAARERLRETNVIRAFFEVIGQSRERKGCGGGQGG